MALLGCFILGFLFFWFTHTSRHIPMRMFGSKPPCTYHLTTGLPDDILQYNIIYHHEIIVFPRQINMLDQ